MSLLAFWLADADIGAGLSSRPGILLLLVAVEAAVFAFLFPAKIAWERLDDTVDTAHDNCHCLLAMAGGFAYFDQLVEH